LKDEAAGDESGNQNKGRDWNSNTINADIQRQASFAANMAQVTGTLTDSLQNFRMP
jgi:hypothetical protein